MIPPSVSTLSSSKPTCFELNTHVFLNTVCVTFMSHLTDDFFFSTKRKFFLSVTKFCRQKVSLVSGIRFCVFEAFKKEKRLCVGVTQIDFYLRCDRIQKDNVRCVTLHVTFQFSFSVEFNCSA